MSKQKAIIKSLVKKNEPTKSTFGTDPNDPWSAKNNMAEASIIGTRSGVLQKFLKSRGIDPRYVSKAQRIGHSKTGEFNKWKRDHMAEDVDKKDTVTFDIPLLIRVLELAREDIKSDMDLHRVVERLIGMRDKGMLTMDDYDTIAQIKENHIAIAMGKMLDDEGSMVLDQLDQLERAIEMIRSYVGKDYKKQLPAWVQAKVTLGTDYIDTVGNYLSTKNEEVSEEVKNLDEISKETLHSYATAGHKKYDTIRYKKDPESMAKKSKLEKGIKRADQKMHPPVQHKPVPKVDMSSPEAYYKSKRPGSYVGDSVEIEGGVLPESKEANYGGDYQDSVRALKAKAEKKPVDMKSLAARMQASYAKDKKQGVAEESCGYATNGPSKSARIIKALYKHHKVVKEELFDGEKEDKSVATYGKKPKFDKTDEKKVKDEVGAAAAVMSGGKALTGTPRDTVEIDPMMRVRPGSPDPMKAGQKFNNTRND
jgi:hypothetical protein